MIRFIPLFFCFVIFCGASLAQTESDAVIRVGFTGSQPFVIPGTDSDGISVDLWREVAFQGDLDYELTHFENVTSGLDAVKNQTVDVLVGPITINSDRAANVTFSQPFFETEMAILAPKIEQGFWDYVKPIFSTTFLFGVLGLFFLLSIVGVLLWMVERKTLTPEGKNSTIGGIGNGIWLAIVTMTTVGYGDLAPKTLAGRVIVGMWMIISLITATSFVAGIATTISQIKGEGDTITSLLHLEGKKVAVPDNQKIIDNITTVGGRPEPVANINEGFERLSNGEVDALVYDVIALEYTYRSHDEGQFVLSKKRIVPQNYGFAFHEASSLKRLVDIEILKLKESGEIQKVIDRWVNSGE
ncbi:amino acid ABC transporter substrate-binding protein [Echinicola strongylocentroti]|uniref:Amino acid ABC transporter substrate-binding protein n=1 Tax=Echinicola strongylocentroti TaxID=1795355 RepID=A0A2Z4IKY0_9BACT|nr:transporter substrate-binding domain-containing protein [Echinicola strongylocentroti]AWW31216.1 amino acid ABC transporter substrate-binding protein [Echinicola strongylocentroti]